VLLVFDHRSKRESSRPAENNVANQEAAQDNSQVQADDEVARQCRRRKAQFIDSTIIESLVQATARRAASCSTPGGDGRRWQKARIAAT
jgi:hypothetical protein